MVPPYGSVRLGTVRAGTHTPAAVPAGACGRAHTAAAPRPKWCLRPEGPVGACGWGWIGSVGRWGGRKSVTVERLPLADLLPTHGGVPAARPIARGPMLPCRSIAAPVATAHFKASLRPSTSPQSRYDNPTTTQRSSNQAAALPALLSSRGACAPPAAAAAAAGLPPGLASSR